MAMAPSRPAQVTPRSASDVSYFLREVLGARLTAVIAGVHDTRTVDRWADGTEIPSRPIDARLRVALDVTEILLQVDSPGVIRLWFMGQNPLLDDDAPALRLATEPDNVLQAARVFAFHG